MYQKELMAWKKLEQTLGVNRITLQLMVGDRIKYQITKRDKYLGVYLRQFIKGTKERLVYILGLKEEATDDWDYICNHYEVFKAFKLVYDGEVIKRAGKVPASYTDIAYCKECKWVYMPAGFNGKQLLSCLWCIRRTQGYQVPPAPKQAYDKETIITKNDKTEAMTGLEG